VPSADRRFFFVHLQKTAGITLKGRLAHAFGKESVYPDRTDGPMPAAVLKPEHLVARFAARRDEIRVVTGHFPLCVSEMLDVEFTTFTILREPVDRTLSYLRHRRARSEEPDTPLEQIYERPMFYESLVHNHMVKMFALTVDSMTHGTRTEIEFRPHHLELAKERLATVDLVGTQPRFDAFCDELARRYELDLGPPVFANRTDPVEVSDAFRARIAEDNAYDVELYEFAQSQLAV
jgi:hypothetical protein